MYSKVGRGDITQNTAAYTIRDMDFFGEPHYFTPDSGSLGQNRVNLTLGAMQCDTLVIWYTR